MIPIHRRHFLAACTSAAAAAIAAEGRSAGPPRSDARFLTRGVVLVPEDLSLADWPQRARNAGLSTIGIHHQNSPQAVINWIGSDPGQRFLEHCGQLGLAVEFELHAMKELLPRDLFDRNPQLFRMNEQGDRVADANCCVHAQPGLETIAEHAVSIAQVLRPTTGRYFYWGDDGQPWCQCPQCRELSPAEQAVIIENRICRALRQSDPRAQVAHLAYVNTLTPPRKVKPDAGVFLEYAPIRRSYDLPLAEQRAAGESDGLEALDANLDVFSRETAQVLEYWLDVSRFSRWTRPAVQLPWRRDVLAADLKTYGQRGIRHITTFAVWVDGDYQRRFGKLDFIDEYGQEF